MKQGFTFSTSASSSVSAFLRSRRRLRRHKHRRYWECEGYYHQSMLLLFLSSSSVMSRQWHTSAKSGSDDEEQKQQQQQREAVRAMRQRFEEGGDGSSSSSSSLHQQQQQHGHHTKVWESLWKDGITPWDLGRPTPALAFELAQRTTRTCWQPTSSAASAAASASATSTLRTLVPGCGAGFDLITLLRHHDDLIASGQIDKACVVGLDVSATSLRRAAQEIESALEFCPLERTTKVKLVKGDFFEPPSSWKIHAVFGGGGGEGSSSNNAGGSTDATSLLCSSTDSVVGTSQFDFIFDYTFFCALPPSLRGAWGKRTAQLLSQSNSNSRLLTLMFPVLLDCEDDEEKDMLLRGPPYPVRPKDYRDVLEAHGLVMESSSGPYQSPETDPTRVGQELVCWWKHQYHSSRSSSSDS